MPIFAVLLPALLHGAALQPPLLLDDPSTELVSRLSLHHGCRLPAQRPWPGESVRECLESILADSGLSELDRPRVEALANRFSPTTPGWRLFSWGSGNDRVGLDAGSTFHLHASAEPTPADRGSLDTLQRDLRTGLRVRPRVDVLLGEDLAIWARPLQVVEASTDKRWKKRSDPDEGVYQTALFASVGDSSKARTTDWLEGAIETRGPFGRAWAGVTTPRWGSLPVEPLMLSGNTLPLPGASISKSIGPLEATVLYARPIGTTWKEDRTLYAHRWGVNAREWSVGFSEMALTVERDLQFLYLVPVFPYMMAEHVLGDPDNKQMDFDATWRPRADMELSAELFLDDLQNYLGFFSSGWGNKWGLGLGVKLVDFTGRGSLDLVQATRMEPWAGTPSSAVLPGAPSNAPVHFGSPLGWSDGPNSARVEWHHQQDLSSRWSWLANAFSGWKGTDSGSSISDRNWRDSSGTWTVAHPSKSWLSGPVVARWQVMLGCERRFDGNFRSRILVGLGMLDLPGRPSTTTPSLQIGVSWNE